MRPALASKGAQVAAGRQGGMAAGARVQGARHVAPGMAHLPRPA